MSQTAQYPLLLPAKHWQHWIASVGVAAFLICNGSTGTPAAAAAPEVLRKRVLQTVEVVFKPFLRAERRLAISHGPDRLASLKREHQEYLDQAAVLASARGAWRRGLEGGDREEVDTQLAPALRELRRRQAACEAQIAEIESGAPRIRRVADLRAALKAAYRLAKDTGWRRYLYDRDAPYADVLLQERIGPVIAGRAFASAVKRNRSVESPSLPDTAFWVGDQQRSGQPQRFWETEVAPRVWDLLYDGKKLASQELNRIDVDLDFFLYGGSSLGDWVRPSVIENRFADVSLEGVDLPENLGDLTFEVLFRGLATTLGYAMNEHLNAPFEGTTLAIDRNNTKKNVGIAWTNRDQVKISDTLMLSPPGDSAELLGFCRSLTESDLPTSVAVKRDELKPVIDLLRVIGELGQLANTTLDELDGRTP